MSDHVDTNGDLMVPLRCGLCGEQIGVVSPSWDVANDERVVARCYVCTAVGEAESILAASSSDGRET